MASQALGRISSNLPGFSLFKLQIEAGGGAETVIEQLKQEKVRYTVYI